jgi:hypothetical protein
MEGQPGAGKTALAASLAAEAGYPYTKLISAESLVNLSESAKCYKITKAFEDAYRSPLSVIVLDNIERLVGYVKIGPRFSNEILQVALSSHHSHPHIRPPPSFHHSSFDTITSFPFHPFCRPLPNPH